MTYVHTGCIQDTEGGFSTTFRDY